MSPAQLAQRRVNTAKMAAAKRARTHCMRGHEFSEGNTYWRPDGRRGCRVCRDDGAYRCKALALAQMIADPRDRRHDSMYGYQCGCRCYPCCFAASEYKRRKRKAC